MKSWLKYAGLTVKLIYYWAIKVYEYVNAAKQNHKSGLLSSTIIQPKVVNKAYKLMMVINLAVKVYSLDALLKIIKNKVSEIAKYFSEPDYFYDTGELPNINFKDLKFAVVDIRIIDYLKQDF